LPPLPAPFAQARAPVDCPLCTERRAPCTPQFPCPCSACCSGSPCQPCRCGCRPPRPSSPAPARQESAPSQATPVQALAEPIRIGVLATRGPALARAQWQPLLRWLAQRVPGHRFVLHPLGLDELAEAVAREHLDFVITNPGQSVSLARQYPLAWLATLKSPAGGTTSPSAPPWWCPPRPPTDTGVTSRASGRRRLGERLRRLPRLSLRGGRTGSSAGALLLHRAVHRLSAGPAHRAAGGREVAAAIVPVCQLERMEREGKVARERFGCWTIRRRPALVARARPGSTPTGPSPRQSGPPPRWRWR
jgi:two-component system sensor histidine kinase TtrS